MVEAFLGIARFVMKSLTSFTSCAGRNLSAFALVAVLAGCTSQAALDARSPDLTFDLPDNYQAVYARTLTSIRRCWPVENFASSSEFIQSDLFNELGYAEINRGRADLMSTSAVAKIKISRAGRGSRVEVTAPFLEAHPAQKDWLVYWMKGGQKCRKIGEGAPPPL
ncbi:hypothetical protein U717_16040 [Rhodobacter capsulatus R121]|jgi:hypothetical protein|nr:hypothetical protein U714_16075 [Rhodobacter capsulatus DE442]ETD74872.1 hypothetical protein U717_16040 [Rhodobacter capsulatus R121]ETE52612.1 hypothetical protein U715_16030 [Rhodobacter capsulatus Y262]